MPHPTGNEYRNGGEYPYSSYSHHAVGHHPSGARGSIVDGASVMRVHHVPSSRVIRSHISSKHGYRGGVRGGGTMSGRGGSHALKYSQQRSFRGISISTAAAQRVVHYHSPSPTLSPRSNTSHSTPVTDNLSSTHNNTKPQENNSTTTTTTTTTPNKTDSAEIAAASALLLSAAGGIKLPTTSIQSPKSSKTQESRQEAQVSPQANQHRNSSKTHRDTPSSSSFSLVPCHVSPSSSNASLASDVVHPFHQEEEKGKTTSITPEKPIDNLSEQQQEEEKEEEDPRDIKMKKNTKDSNSTQESNPSKPSNKTSKKPQEQEEETRVAPTTKTHTSPPPPPSIVLLPHFPSLLHDVLTTSPYASKVLEWLPHGQGWRVLRWDEMSSKVIPTYFNEFCAAGESGGEEEEDAVEMFLWHVAAWGFKEVKKGVDLGSWRHGLFLRGNPDLCRKMHLSGTPPNGSLFGSSSSTTTKEGKDHMENVNTQTDEQEKDSEETKDTSSVENQDANAMYELHARSRLLQKRKREHNQNQNDDNDTNNQQKQAEEKTSSTVSTVQYRSSNSCSTRFIPRPNTKNIVVSSDSKTAAPPREMLQVPKLNMMERTDSSSSASTSEPVLEEEGEKTVTVGTAGVVGSNRGRSSFSSPLKKRVVSSVIVSSPARSVGGGSSRNASPYRRGRVPSSLQHVSHQDEYHPSYYPSSSVQDSVQDGYEYGTAAADVSPRRTISPSRRSRFVSFHASDRHASNESVRIVETQHLPSSSQYHGGRHGRVVRLAETSSPHERVPSRHYHHHHQHHHNEQQQQRMVSASLTNSTIVMTREEEEDENDEYQHRHYTYVDVPKGHVALSPAEHHHHHSHPPRRVGGHSRKISDLSPSSSSHQYHHYNPPSSSSSLPPAGGGGDGGRDDEDETHHRDVLSSSSSPPHIDYTRGSGTTSPPTVSSPTQERGVGGAPGQLRSGRGGARVALPSSSSSQSSSSRVRKESPCTTEEQSQSPRKKQSSSFPVSQRGKGKRGPVRVALGPSLSSSPSEKSTPATAAGPAALSSTFQPGYYDPVTQTVVVEHPSAPSSDGYKEHHGRASAHYKEVEHYASSPSSPSSSTVQEQQQLKAVPVSHEAAAVSSLPVAVAVSKKSKRARFV